MVPVVPSPYSSGERWAISASLQAGLMNIDFTERIGVSAHIPSADGAGSVRTIWRGIALDLGSLAFRLSEAPHRSYYKLLKSLVCQHHHGAPHLECPHISSARAHDRARCRVLARWPSRVSARLLPARSRAITAVPAPVRWAAVAAHDAGCLQFFGNHPALADRKAFLVYLAPLHDTEWVVYAKKPFGGPEQVLRYMARYTHRVAIDDEGASFKWKDYRVEGPARATNS